MVENDHVDLASTKRGFLCQSRGTALHDRMSASRANFYVSNVCFGDLLQPEADSLDEFSCGLPNVQTRIGEYPVCQPASHG